MPFLLPGEHGAEGRLAVAAVLEEHAGDGLVHRLGHVDAVPVDVPGRLRAGGGDLRRAAGGEDLEVVGAAAGAAARLEGLREAVPRRRPHDGEVGGVVVGVGDDGGRGLLPEPPDAGQEAPVVGVALRVDGGGAADVVAVLRPRQRHGQWQATGERQPLHDDVLGALLQQRLPCIDEIS
uniref:DUF834 domain-containing protein n=1 Tax=Oryza brachyantha TaxID=4533 RepID=J3LUQ2_ORYBR